MSGLNDPRTRLQTVLFQVLYNTCLQRYAFWWRSCVLMEILRKSWQKGLRVWNFELLWVVFKWHHGSEGVKLKQYGPYLSQLRWSNIVLISRLSYSCQRLLWSNIVLISRLSYSCQRLLWSSIAHTVHIFRWLSWRKICHISRLF